MESFEQVANQYTPMIHKIISSLRIFTNKDEFFQLGLITLWEAYQRFEPEKGDFMNYAYTSIKGKFQTEMTRANRHHDRNHHPQEGFWEYFVDENSICPLEEDILLTYCQAGELTENQTKWVLYSFLKQLNIKEIAEIEHVSLSAVKSWRTGAMRKLRKARLEDKIF